MASLQLDPSGNFHVKFRFGGKQFRRSLKTKFRRKAEAAASHVEENIRLIEAGRIELPDDVDVPTFLLSDGKLASKPKPVAQIRLKDLLPRFLKQTPDGSIEQTTVVLLEIHMRHICRELGGNKTLRTVSTSDLQEYVTTRSQEPGQYGNLSAVTIRKEISTFGSLWNWAKSNGFVSSDFPRAGLVFPKSDEKPAFQTWTQIQRQIDRDQLDDESAKRLWECLYLNRTELTELLKYVKGKTRLTFLHPMCVLAAYTGARRSELCRMQTGDIDLQSSTVTIRERKRSRKQRTTRTVQLAELVCPIVEEWLQTKLPSPFLFPTDDGVDARRPERVGRQLSRTLDGSQWSVVHGWHTFRHSFISNCASQGVDQRFIDSWVGHQTDEQRRRYRHLFPHSQQDAIDSVFR
ncbi:site-specific integrase [bacterium]|nr:site-specific integrase [bacterium]